MNYIFNREPYTDWKIVLMDRSIDKQMEEIEPNDDWICDEFECFYRTAIKDGKECEMFTMIVNGTEYDILQLQLFKNGDIRYISRIPFYVDVIKREKRVEILPLVYCSVDEKSRNIKLKDMLE